MADETGLADDRGRRSRRKVSGRSSVREYGQPARLPPTRKWPEGEVAPPRPDPIWEVEPAAGPDPDVPGSILDEEARSKVIHALRVGASRFLACEQAGCLVEDLEATLLADRRFAALVRNAEGARLDDIRLTLHEAAMGGNAGVGLQLVRMDAEDRLAREVVEQGRQRVRNETRVADAVAGSGRMDLGALDQAQFSRFRALHDRFERGEVLGPEASMEYVRLLQRACLGRSPRGSAPALPHRETPITDEALFGVDNNDPG